MKFIKQSNRAQPKVSLILLDWSVRESFHLLDYLSRQDLDRDLFEVVIIEYYSRVSDAIRPFDQQVDSWLLLEMPEDCYYHKHLMYNAGIAVAKGDICVICDSDAMVKEGFINAIIREFDSNPNIVLHIDQFRNARKDLYPFCYPDFAQVTGKGCINNVDGKTRGIMDDKDPIHNRNYGACMCARRADLIAIGGADEHIDYLGHICGPYELTFRLVNLGHREIWHQSEFMYHTWHPGQAGEDNYLGPHDGRHVSTTALDALISGRIMPLVENETIRNLRLIDDVKLDAQTFRISPAYLHDWRKENLRHGQNWIAGNTTRKMWHGFVVNHNIDGYRAYPRFIGHPDFSQYTGRFDVHGATEPELLKNLYNSIPFRFRLVFPVVALLTFISKAFGLSLLYLQRRLARLAQGVQA
ncbi:MAG: glycosyltransferase [Methylobacter sp.]|nr:glycosyltransferase [Methylobacter sp.]